MKIIYIDASTSGIAGDMLFAALLDAGADLPRVLTHLRRLPLADWDIAFSRVNRHGFAAADISISFPPQHTHRHLRNILAMIDAAAFPPRAKNIACAAFNALADAEAAAHGSSRDSVHFHEVGAVDSILDICGVALAADDLDIMACYASALPLSSGFVDCAHGRLPVPAPAVLHLLADWPLIPTDITGELITPTGAACLRALNARPELPAFTLRSSGLGAGKRQLPRPNFLRLLYGEACADMAADQVDIICTNIDDCSGETLAALWDKAFELGAKDMCYAPLLMKKGRPAWQLQMIVPAGEAPRFMPLIFAETSAIGLRYHTESRLLAAREIISVVTKYGEIAVKISGDNIAPEADSVQEAAARHNIPFKLVFQAALAAAFQLKESE